MNPLSNHQIGQAQHQEYEASYGSSYNGDRTENEGDPLLSWRKMALALSSASLAALILALASLF